MKVSEQQSLHQVGWQRFRHVVTPDELAILLEEAAIVAGIELQRKRGGGRGILCDCPILARHAWRGALAGLAQSLLGAKARPVRGLFFDKQPGANWKVPWHQDLTIAVRERHDVPGYGPWSVKDGVPHVQPPVEVLEQMVALRLHLDDCPEENGALRVLENTHRHGRLAAGEIREARRASAEIVCEAQAGDVIAMRSLALHASSASTRPEHRRVIHVEYAAVDLPLPLEWAESAPIPRSSP